MTGKSQGVRDEIGFLQAAVVRPTGEKLLLDLLDVARLPDGGKSEPPGPAVMSV